MFHAHGTGLGKAHDVTGKQTALGSSDCRGCQENRLLGERMKSVMIDRLVQEVAL